MEQINEKVFDRRVIGFSAVAALVGVGIALAFSASAASVDSAPGAGGRFFGVHGCDPEQHSAREAALEAHDYAAWKKLVEESGRGGRILAVVNEDNFDTFVALHEAMERGDTKKISELRTELALHDSVGFSGRGMGMHGRWSGGGR